MDISFLAFSMALVALFVVSSFLILIFSRLERKQKQKRNRFFQA